MIKKFFNWLAEKPSCQYTLGGDGLSFKFNRAARLVERVVSVPSLVTGTALGLIAIPVAMTGGLVAAAPVLATGMLVAAFGKAAGLVKGGITHLIAKGVSSLVNHLTRPRHKQV